MWYELDEDKLYYYCAIMVIGDIYGCGEHVIIL